MLFSFLLLQPPETPRAKLFDHAEKSNFKRFARTGFGNLIRGLGTNLFSAHLLPDDVTDLRLNLLHGGRLVTSLLRRDVVGPPHPGDERGVALTASDVVRGAAQVLLQQLVILRIEDELFQISRL